jgi:hypothetical protein
MRRAKRQYHFHSSTWIGLSVILLGIYLVLALPSVSNLWFLPSEGLRPPVRDTVRVMAQYGQIVCSSIGDGASTENAQWDRYQWLRRHATTEELVQLVQLTDGTVKGYAFMALHQRRYAHLFSLLMESINDTTTLWYGCHCLTGQEYTARDFMVREYLKYGYYDDTHTYHPSPEQKALLSKHIRIEQVDHTP